MTAILDRIRQPELPSEAVGDSGVHYDTPPRVFELLLDRNMNYSSGVYPKGDEDLDAAQLVKMGKVAHWLDLKPGARLLDVGCGWFGPALHMAEHYGAHVTGVTLSPVQREYGLAWASRRGFGQAVQIDVADVLAMPYPPGSFDAIMFLESIIHMPPKRRIFEACCTLLRPGGRLFVQESNYDRDSQNAKYRGDRGNREVDQAFGYTMDMVSAGRMQMEMEEAGLVPFALENISRDYVRTLSQWLQNLDGHADEMRAVSPRAYLMLRRYLMIALATYRAGNTVCHMITAEKPGRA
jgi:cyclopropane-fatty-acyl-phospholipid synthase